VSKLGLVKWFGEDICELVLDINVVQIDITFLCALFLSGGLGFCLHLWRWCCNKTKALT
jgi:hypothetical protein